MGNEMYLNDTLSQFRPITLAEMDSVRLLDRVDTKFTFRMAELTGILGEMLKDYDILDIDGRRISRYESVYFDTADHQLYMHHHNGKLNRYKIRFRKYVDTEITFFEIKLKTNKGRMIKERVQVPGIGDVISDGAEEFLAKKTTLDPALLKPALVIRYSRMTFVGRNFPERITIDIDLSYSLGTNESFYPQLVIAESKQSGSAPTSFSELMHIHHIRNLSISKYCLGIASLADHIKCNNFKFKIHHINQLNHGNQ